MSKCPKCGDSRAYIGFSSIECENEKCEHFKVQEKKVCSCCGKESCQHIGRISRIRSIIQAGRAIREQEAIDPRNIESNMRKAMAIAKAMRPCVLFIDELDGPEALCPDGWWPTPPKETLK